MRMIPLIQYNAMKKNFFEIQHYFGIKNLFYYYFISFKLIPIEVMAFLKLIKLQHVI